MTFDTYETSVAQGEPILLFDFALGIAHFRYTTADRPITYQTDAFAPAPIKRSNPIQSQDVRRKSMTVTAPRDIPVAALWSAYAPSTDVLLTITELHYTDPDAQGIVDFVGRVIGPTWKGSTVELLCEPVYTSVQTTGLRRRWGVGCPHVLYGPGCTLNPAPFGRTGALTTVSGLDITSPAFTLPAGLAFKGGYVEWDSGFGYVERRTIDGVAGTTLTLAYGSPQLAIGLEVTAFPGCARNLAACNSLGNAINYGGQPFIPIKNPMDGSVANPIY